MIIDISDLPATATPAVKSFVSTVREGYRTQNGRWEGWVKAAGTIAEASPVLYFELCLGVGSLMRPMFKNMPGGIFHIKGRSTTGKTLALQTVLSLRADPADMTWCFDGQATLKWYTVAAEQNFLCLDDIHVAIMPDSGACRPIPPAYFQMFEDNSAPHTTIISTSVKGLSDLAGRPFTQGYEIDADDASTPIWPNMPDRDPWWMDAWMSELKMNYGIAFDKVADSLVQQHQALLVEHATLEKAIPARIQGGRRSILILAQMGRTWLKQHAGIHIDEFTLYDSLLKRRSTQA